MARGGGVVGHTQNTYWMAFFLSPKHVRRDCMTGEMEM